jgi:hypothetical protein
VFFNILAGKAVIRSMEGPSESCDPASSVPRNAGRMPSEAVDVVRPTGE